MCIKNGVWCQTNTDDEVPQILIDHWIFHSFSLGKCQGYCITLLAVFDIHIFPTVILLCIVYEKTTHNIM